MSKKEDRPKLFVLDIHPVCRMHSAVLSGRWCGDQRPLCGPAAGGCQSVEFGFITTV